MICLSLLVPVCFQTLHDGGIKTAIREISVFVQELNALPCRLGRQGAYMVGL